MIGSHRRSAWMRNRSCCMPMSSLLFPLSQVIPSAWITSTNAVARATCSGWRLMEVTAQRTMDDYAKVVRWLVDEIYPHAEYIRRGRRRT